MYGGTLNGIERKESAILLPGLHALVAAERHADLIRAANGRHEPDAAVEQHTPEITIRPSHVRDEAALQALAELEGRSLPPGPLLVAEVDGDVTAVLPVAGGEPLADPFEATTAAVSLLELRAEQLAA